MKFLEWVLVVAVSISVLYPAGCLVIDGIRENLRKKANSRFDKKMYDYSPMYPKQDHPICHT